MADRCLPAATRLDGASRPRCSRELATWAVLAEQTWPKDAVGQITALRQIAGESPINVDAAVKRFSGAKRDLIERHVETLAILGEVQRLDDGRYSAFAMVTSQRAAPCHGGKQSGRPIRAPALSFDACPTYLLGRDGAQRGGELPAFLLDRL